MKKKLSVLICMITCLLCFTACGSKKTESEHQKDNLTYAEKNATSVVEMLTAICEKSPTSFDDMTNEEVAYICESALELNADGYAIKNAMISIESGLKSIGEITGIGEVKGRVDGNQIIVEVQISGKDKDAVAEVIFSNDFFLQVQAVALNPKSSIGEKMRKAGMDTLIGMGTVFSVLILISLLISCFKFIPMAQKAIAARKEAKNSEKETGIDNAVAQITAREEEAEEADDLELVAVIAAAIAAYEGASSTDGFVVRSIRKRA